MNVKLVNRPDSAWVKCNANLGGVGGNRQISNLSLSPVISHFFGVAIAGVVPLSSHPIKRIIRSVPRHIQKVLVLTSQIAFVLDT